MARILKVLTALESRVSKIEERSAQAAKATSLEYLPFGLPPGYIPPVQEYVDQSQVPLSIPVNATVAYTNKQEVL